MMTDNELKQQLVQTTTELYRAGVVTATGGNISVRSAEHEDAAWITPTQIFKGALTPEDMVLINMDGKKIAGSYKPSVESVYHAGILKCRSDVNAVVHSHAPFATIFGMADMEILPITAEAILLAKFPIIPFHLGGSAELASAVTDKLGISVAQGAFLRNHGLVTVGRDLRKAADVTLTVEHTVKMLLYLRMAGVSPTLLDEKKIEIIKKFDFWF